MAAHAELLSVLGRYYHSLGETVTMFAAVNKSKNYIATSFQLSIFLKSVLDDLEEKKVLSRNEDTEETFAAVLLNAEFALIKIWASTELRFNPFLKHWVDVIERCEPILRLASARQDLPISRWWILAHTARLDLIKGALGIHPLDEQMTPAELIEGINSIRLSPTDLSPYLNLLAAQGLYKPSNSASASGVSAQEDPIANGEIQDDEASNRTSNIESGNASELAIPVVFSQQIAQNSAPDPDLFVKFLTNSPSEALHWLVRLPPTLTALDFATKLLTSSIFDEYGISPGDLARQHLQHMLLQIEGMRPAGDSDDFDGDSGLQQNTEEQARAVTLVVMYTRNLLARNIVDIETISLDIQEICIRYIWLPQVREFRSWIQLSMIGGGPFLSEDLLNLT